MSETIEQSSAPARIVCTPGTCGGRPRLDGHRLDVDWYGEIRQLYGAGANAYILRNWPYLRDKQVQCMSDFYDAQPMTGIFDHLAGDEITLTHPGEHKPTHHKLAGDCTFTLKGDEVFQSWLRRGMEVELIGDPATEVKVRKV